MAKRIHTDRKTHKKNDPRVLAFKRAYLDATNPKTFCNIRQSALLAGFSESYSNNLSGNTNVAKWWLEFQKDGEFKRAELLRESEQHFYNVLQTPDDTEDKERYKLKQRTAEFVSERIGKDVYSTRHEVTGKDGRQLYETKDEKASEKVSELFKGVQAEPAPAKKG